MNIIRLFDYQNGTIIPTEHCHALKSLKVIMDKYPDNYIKVYLYIYYMTHPDPAENPFFHMDENDKEELILTEIQADFSTDDKDIAKALEFCNTLYDTPTRRAYEGAKSMMDKLAKFFKKGTLTTGRDGSLDSMVRTMEKYDKLRESFKGVEKDYMEEMKAITRGGSFEAYDMK